MKPGGIGRLAMKTKNTNTACGTMLSEKLYDCWIAGLKECGNLNNRWFWYQEHVYEWCPLLPEELKRSKRYKK